MAFIVTVLQAYGIAFVVLLHMSLLICTPDHQRRLPAGCLFDARTIVATEIIEVAKSALQLLPLTVEQVRGIAGFLLLGDLALVFLLIWRICKNLLGKIVQVFMLAGLLLGLTYLYTLYTDRMEQKIIQFN